MRTRKSGRKDGKEEGNGRKKTRKDKTEGPESNRKMVTMRK